MAILEISTDQVIQLIRQLPAPDRNAVLDALAEDREAWWSNTASTGEEVMRRLARERGLDWDELSEIARETFVDALLHEAA